MTFRRLAPLAALLAVLTACSDTPRPPAAPPEEVPIAKAHAAALAKAGTLTAADLRGWRAAKPDPDADDSGDDAITRCMGREPRPYAASTEVDFEKGDVTLSTGTDVVATLERAEDDLADFRNPALASCFEEALRAELPAGVSLEPVSRRAFRVDVPGADGTFGFTLVVGVRGPGGTFRMTFAVAGALVGHAEVFVTALGQRGLPDDATLVRLLRTAATRVRRVPAPSGSARPTPAG